MTPAVSPADAGWLLSCAARGAGVDIQLKAGHMTQAEAARARKWATSIARGGQPTMDLQRGLDYLDQH